jgi:hypothetical protein
MTMPDLENCQHMGDGWCLDCVRTLQANELPPEAVDWTMEVEVPADLRLRWSICPVFGCGRGKYQLIGAYMGRVVAVVALLRIPNRPSGWIWATVEPDPIHGMYETDEAAMRAVEEFFFTMLADATAEL